MLISMVFCGVLICGCEENMQSAGPDKSVMNEAVVNSMLEVQVRNGVIAQHTLYPYHFEANSEALTEIGERNIRILADHFKNNGGSLNICRDHSSDELYDKRVAQVKSQLEELGVEGDRIVISDGMPGGEGMGSERLVTIMEKEYESRPLRGMSGTGVSTGMVSERAYTR
jgi:hypothetical protein